MQCWDKTHYWCAEEGGGVMGDGRGRATADPHGGGRLGVVPDADRRRMGASAFRHG